mgnify:CR=1 FL=1
MKTDFKVLYKKHYAKLYTLAFRMTGNREDAEDVLQNSFLNAFKSYEKFQGRSKPYTWLYRIVINASKRYYNKHYKLPVTEYADELDISEKAVYKHINSFGKTENKALIEITRETCLQMFMNCMPPKFRSVYTLRIMLQLNTKDTAAVLGISQGAVKVNLHRAKKTIYSHMKGRCSLIKPGSMCDCRLFAKYIKETKQTNKYIDIELIRNNEQNAVDDFNTEMDEIIKIVKLYNNQIKPKLFESFLSELKELVNRKDISLLD